MGKKLRTAIRAASKVQERELLRKARALRAHPEVLVPRCLAESCPRCPFDSLLRKLEKVARDGEDEKRLEWLTRRGHPLARAYAATLLLGVQGKVRYLGPAQTPYGKVHFAQGGKAPRDQLVGVQYHDVPELRVLTVGRWARKKRLYVYSLEEEMVTTCREDRPPAAFVEETLRRLPRTLQEADGERRCPHVPGEPALVVTWTGADLPLVLCAKCAIPEGNLPAFVGRRMVTPKRARPFTVALRMDLGCNGAVCGLGTDRPLESEEAQEYLAGEVGEAELLAEETERALVAAAAQGAFLVGRRCFEDDVEAFLAAVGVPEDLRPAGSTVLEAGEAGLYVPEASLAKFAEALDEELLADLVRSYLGDEEPADALLEDAEAEGWSHEALLQRALGRRRDADALAHLPSWGRLTPVAALADGIARAYRTHGAEEAVVRARQALDSGRKRKVVAMAFLEALEAAAGKGWTFRQEEKQLADFLVGTAKELLAAEGDAYREVLQRLLTMSGSGESLPET